MATEKAEIIDTKDQKKVNIKANVLKDIRSIQLKLKTMQLKLMTLKQMQLNPTNSTRTPNQIDEINNFEATHATEN